MSTLPKVNPVAAAVSTTSAPEIMHQEPALRASPELIALIKHQDEERGWRRRPSHNWGPSSLADSALVKRALRDAEGGSR